MKRVLIFLIPLALAVMMPGASHGGNQDGADVERKLLDGVEADSLGGHAADIVARVKVGVDLSRDLRTKMAGAGTEDSLVLEMRYLKLRVALVTDIHELADVLIELEKQNPQERLRPEVEAAYEYVTPLLWEYIAHRTTQIDEARNRRHATAVQDRLALEDEILTLTQWLDEAFDLSRIHVTKLDKLGMESSGAIEILETLLGSRAMDLSGRIDFVLARIDRLTARLQDTPDDADPQLLLLAAHRSLETNTGSMAATLELMAALKMPAEEYRAQLAEATRDISTVILDSGAAVSLINRATGRIWSWFVETGPGLIVKIALFIALLYIFRFLSRLAKKGTVKALDSSKVDVSTLLRRMIITAVANVVMILGLLIALSQLGVNLGPLLAGLGVVGFIIGFALQDTLSNFAAGMMILIYRPYDVGDLVDSAGVFGKVSKMSLVSTTILTIDNQTIIIPNSKIWGDVIKNVTAQDNRRIDMTFGISYTDDIPKAEQVFMDILKGHDKILDDPEPMVKLHELGDSSVNFVVRPWVAVDDYWDVYWDVTRAVKMRFDEDGISIPFPQRDVHLYNEETGTREEK